MACEMKRPTQITNCEKRSDSSPCQSRPSFLSPKKNMSITFSNLSYTVKSKFGRGTTTILQDISGHLSPGELTAIMGPSGCGKSSLMNVLAGFATRGVTGTVLANGEERDLQNFFQHTCYIMQDDELQPLLTIREAMNMAAYLKLGRISSDVRNFQINTILDALGLSESENTQALLLSGGQRKRLAIALELINNPPLMFFDEPTSGLDSSSSWHCIKLLKRLAQEGRTVVCSIHQPSALLFEQFDTLYALGNGRCMYQGYVNELVPYLSRHNFICPAYHNPADFLLEVLVGEHGPTNSLGMSTESKEANVTSLNVSSFSETSKESEESVRKEAPQRVVNESAEELPKVSSNSSLILQLHVLLHRNYLIYIRNPFLTKTRIVMHAMIGLFIGLLYYDIGNDAAYVMDNFGFLYFCIMFIQFTAFSSKLLSFPLEWPILMREYFNGWYSLKSYFLAGVAADAPVQVLCTLAYILVSYYLTSQPPEIHRLFLFFYVVLLVGLISQIIGVLTGLTMGMQNGMVFGPLAILPFLIFSGFFVSMKDAPKYFEWLFHMSYLKYGLEAVMQAMYSYGREKLPCSTEYCQFKLPMKFLEELHMVDAKYWVDIIFLTSLYFVLLAVTYTALKVKLRRR